MNELTAKQKQILLDQQQARPRIWIDPDEHERNERIIHHIKDMARKSQMKGIK